MTDVVEDMIRVAAFREAYNAVCRVIDRDADVDREGIIDNILAELASLAGIP